MLAHKLSQYTDIVTLVLEEIKAVHATKSQLQEVVIQALLRDAYQTRRIFKRVSHSFAVAELHSVIQFAPKRDSLNDEADLTLFCPLQVYGIKQAR